MEEYNAYNGNGRGEEPYLQRNKFEKDMAGLKGGNNLETKAATILTDNGRGETETFIVQTIRTEKEGTYVVVQYLNSKDETKRIILPPKVTATIKRQDSALADKARRNAAKAKAKERKERGDMSALLRPEVVAKAKAALARARERKKALRAKKLAQVGA